MPTETFFNLPKEKQQRILLAAKKEFSRAALKEASIANVVKDAEIPRGSFYQYFENKEDLYYYYFHQVRRDSHRYLIHSIQEANGDIFVGSEAFFAHLIPEIFVGEHAHFYKNMFMTMDYHGFRKVTPHIEKQAKPHIHEKKKEQKELLDVIDRSLLKVKDDHELHLLLQMLMHIGFTSAADGYRRAVNGQYDVEKTLERIQCKLNWLKSGARKDLDR
ncbi:TetR/AcrR family transcriptional regulator [Enterococcus olivae]